MTSARIPEGPVPSAAVALLAPGQPMPSPWWIDPSMPACDLCQRPSEQLWPLATAPVEDELLAGELLICRICADAIRPVSTSSTPTTNNKEKKNAELIGPTMSDPGCPPTLTY